MTVWWTLWKSIYLPSYEVSVLMGIKMQTDLFIALTVRHVLQMTQFHKKPPNCYKTTLTVQCPDIMYRVTTS